MQSANRLSHERSGENLKQDIAQGLFTLRTSWGWTRKEMAELLFEVSPGSLAVWETCARLPKGMHLLRIARLLGLQLMDYPKDALRSSGVLCAQRRGQLTGRKPTPVIDVGALITMSRVRAGMSVKELAELWEVSPHSLRNWEEGALPKRDNAMKVAHHLGLPPTAIGII